MAKKTVVAALLTAVVFGGCSARRGPADARAQVGFGIDMAQQGLWSEALFRFEQAAGMRGEDPRLLNNLAVASEALGRFDEALDYYRRALALAPGNRDLKANYDRFASFYESFRARDEEAAVAAVTAAEPAAGEEPPAAGPAALPAPPVEMPQPPVPEATPPEDVFGPEDVEEGSEPPSAASGRTAR